VLFKHVADFHICIVQAFSKKYGIPEDEIMQTIQESEEFKNMHVDPVLHDDRLGYFSQHATEAAVVQPDQPEAAIMQPDAAIVQPDQPEAAIMQPDAAIVTKKRVVRKKTQVTPTSEKVITTDEANQTPQITMSQTPEALPGIVEKKKIIRKKVAAAAATTVELDRNDDDIQTHTHTHTHTHTPMPTTSPILTPALHSDALVQLLTKDTTSSAQPRKKIIRKKA